jgi:hypothetical protein
MRSQAAGHFIGIKAALALFIVLIEILFINSLASAGIEFILSSVAVTVALLIQLQFAVRPTAESPADMIVFIFNWLFLDLAPKLQLINMPQRLINTSTVVVDRVALTNLVCALFMIAFTLLYGLLTKRFEDAPQKRGRAPARTAPQQEFTAAAVGLALIICLAVVAVAAPSAYATVETAGAATPGTIIVKRCLLFLPSATLLILLNETVRSGRKLQFSRVCVLLLLLLLVFVTENPSTEKRNALGPLYIALLLVAFPVWFAGWNRRMLLLVSGMVLIFPAITIFTHNRQQTLGAVSMSQVVEQIGDHYYSINYDSWANIYTAVEVVQVHGMQWGHQLLGALLFFVPSSIWSGKPLASGIFLADYLIANYSMWFTNLSAPLVAEGYLDFGAAGVLAYAAAMAFAVTGLNAMARSKGNYIRFPVAVYGSVFLMLVLRGSLMIAVAYLVAAFLAFAAAYALLSLKLGVRRVARRVPAQQSTAVS